MFAEMASHIRQELAVERGQRFEKEQEVPSWL
jgi:hypothetical protein